MSGMDVLAVMQAAAAECICRASVVKPSRHLAESQAGALMEARAIVAQLLEALQKLVDSCDDSDGMQYGTLGTSFIRSIASAAIAKATGEPHETPL